MIEDNDKLEKDWEEILNNSRLTNTEANIESISPKYRKQIKFFQDLDRSYWDDEINNILYDIEPTQIEEIRTLTPTINKEGKIVVPTLIIYYEKVSR